VFKKEKKKKEKENPHSSQLGSNVSAKIALESVPFSCVYVLVHRPLRVPLYRHAATTWTTWSDCGGGVNDDGGLKSEPVIPAMAPTCLLHHILTRHAFVLIQEQRILVCKLPMLPTAPVSLISHHPPLFQELMDQTNIIQRVNSAISIFFKHASKHWDLSSNLCTPYPWHRSWAKTEAVPYCRGREGMDRTI